MSAFNPPLYAGRKVEGFYASTVNWETAKSVTLHVLETSKTSTLLKVAAVTACSGPTTVNMGVKGQTATFSVTTANAVAFATDVIWSSV